MNRRTLKTEKLLSLSLPENKFLSCNEWARKGFSVLPISVICAGGIPARKQTLMLHVSILIF